MRRQTQEIRRAGAEQTDAIWAAANAQMEQNALHHARTEALMEAQLETQFAAAQEQARQTAIAEAAFHAQTNFHWSQYLQTAHGQAYKAWESAAVTFQHLLVSYSARWREAWVDAAMEAGGPIPSFPHRVSLPKTNRYKWQMGAVIGLAMIAIAGLGIPFLLRMLCLVGSVLLAVMADRQHVAAEQARAQAEKEAFLADHAARRQQRLGVDNVALYELPPGTDTQQFTVVSTQPLIGAVVLHGWTSEDVPEYVANLSAFMEQARSGFPAPGELPVLRFPTKLPAQPIFPPRVQEVLADILQGEVDYMHLPGAPLGPTS